MNSLCETSDLLVFSHLRWDFIFQRPQQLLSRQAKHRRVFYVEDAIVGHAQRPCLSFKSSPEGIKIIVPHLPEFLSESEMNQTIRVMLNEFIQEEEISGYTSLYYTSKALSYTRDLTPLMIIFDNMDIRQNENENELMAKSDLILSGTNGVDYAHFSQARKALIEPEDQINIPHPRIGYYGVVDERLDLKLMEKIAELRPEFQFVLIGPLEGMEQNSLARQPNIHYLGIKDYHAVPLYLSSWDCIFTPFCLGKTEHFMNPTNTLEFLAAGKPIVSTYSVCNSKLVHVAKEAEAFAEKIESAINESSYDPEWLERVDHFLDGHSWEAAFHQMSKLETKSREDKQQLFIPAYMDQALQAIGIV